MDLRELWTVAAMSLRTPCQLYRRRPRPEIFLNSIATPVDVPVDWIADGRGPHRLAASGRAPCLGVRSTRSLRARCPANSIGSRTGARALREWFRGICERLTWAARLARMRWRISRRSIDFLSAMKPVARSSVTVMAHGRAISHSRRHGGGAHRGVTASHRRGDRAGDDRRGLHPRQGLVEGHCAR